LPAYTSLKQATAADLENGIVYFSKVASSERRAERLLQMLKDQQGINIGCMVDLYTHGLQTATRAHRDGQDEETVVCALLHDIGELITPVAHGEIASSILRPYISPENYWILHHHEIFQVESRERFTIDAAADLIDAADVILCAGLLLCTNGGNEERS
jgi:predicted HD phosphohydrolase